MSVETRLCPRDSRTLKIGNLTSEQRHLVLALVYAAKKAPASPKASAEEVDRVSPRTVSRP